MHATIHPLIDLYTAADGWIDATVAALTSAAGTEPDAFMASQVMVGPAGTLLALWPTEAAAHAAASLGPAPASGPGRVHAVAWRDPGDLGPARFCQAIMFGATDDPAMLEARRVATVERIVPAIESMPGWQTSVECAADDGSHTTFVFGASVEQMEQMARRVLTSPLLPHEDRALLPGPQRVELHRVLRAATTAAVSP